MRPASTAPDASGESGFLPWNTASIGEAEITEVVDTLRSGWLTGGPKAARFEDAVRERLGTEDAFAVTSCTAALHLALLAAEIGAGDEVISPSLTFCAAVNAVEQVGAEPVLVDVEPLTHNLSPESVAAAMTPRTRAVIAMHYGGHPCDLDALREITEERGLLLIEDAAHALGASYRGRPAGSFGDLATFSFYANKVMTTGEGGMLVGRRELVEKARLLGRHGIDSSAWRRHGSRRTAQYDVVLPGLKYVMSDITASLGIHQLDALDGFLARRAEIAHTYTGALADVPGVVPPHVDDDVTPGWFLYAVLVDPDSAGLSRDEMAAELAERGIGTSFHFQPVHTLTHYRALPSRPLPRTEYAGERLLSLPCYPAMTDADVDRVADAVRRIVQDRVRGGRAHV
ncbi:DegT/DnrJ/EryC1/StrS family aminotransferase [Streptomyces sulphureus]|uniref:DegT/DnrJ/EryC1/StrS family aminotransferase n=1 Tax=Streptomyces sulphureus TaxID=47758 RepID=UPI00036C3FF0|nr:DegT/DnrJ/EryC1/StrS family aminotransferase [Streptomyces sulphureus]